MKNSLEYATATVLCAATLALVLPAHAQPNQQEYMRQQEMQRQMELQRRQQEYMRQQEMQRQQYLQQQEQQRQARERQMQRQYEQDMSRQRAEHQRNTEQGARMQQDAERQRMENTRQPPGGGPGGAASATVYAHVAVAWHPDASDVWATWNHRTEDAARQSALAACGTVMGGGCTIATNAWNSFIAIARAQDGMLYSGWGATARAANAEAANACKKYVPNCQIVRTFGTLPSPLGTIGPVDEYFPDSVARNHYVIVGWPKATPAARWLNKAWVASGQGFEAIQKSLLERCRQDTGVECIMTQSAPNNALVFKFKDDSGQESWLNALSREHAEQRVNAECAQRNRKACAIVATYDAFTPRLEIVDSQASTLPKRAEGYFAVAWPSKAIPSWQNLVVSTGHANLEDAKRAAIARCEADSLANCTLLGEVDDGTYFLLALYQDNKGSVRWFMHNTQAQIEKMVKEDCNGSGLTCRRIALVDARKPGTAVHSIVD